MKKLPGWLWVLGAAFVVAGLLSPFASSWPDGLEKVAERIGFLARGEGAALVASPLPDYQMPGITHERLSTALAGILGALAVFALLWFLGRLLASRAHRAHADTTH